MAAENADQLETPRTSSSGSLGWSTATPAAECARRSVREPGAPPELVGSLLAGKASDATIALAKRAVAARQRTFDQTIEGYVTRRRREPNRGDRT